MTAGGKKVESGQFKAEKRKPETGQGHESRKYIVLTWTAAQRKANRQCERPR